MSTKPLSVCRMQFVASSDTINSTDSKVSDETPRSSPGGEPPGGRDRFRLVREGAYVLHGFLDVQCVGESH